MNTKLKQFALSALTFAAFVSFSIPAWSAYKLNSNVKDATPALKAAAEIGVVTYNNPDMQSLANKDAIVVMSFGTTYKQTRKATIEATVAQIQAAHPDTKVITAFTSHIIIDRIAKNEGIKFPTPEQALADLKAAGYTRIALATLDVIPGMEYAYDKAIFDIYKTQFKKMTLGTSLMYWMGQEDQRDDIVQALKALSTEFPKTGKDDAILIMAHGTPYPTNAYYSVIQDRINQLNFNNVYLYTVEGWPRLENIIPKLKAAHIKHVTLLPMMMVAGDHANNDMAGSDPDSHKSILEKEGFKVTPYIHGMGENKAIRSMFAARAEESWNALQVDK